MKKISLILGFTIISFAGFSQKSSKSAASVLVIKDSLTWMAGEWRGLGYQTDGVSWDIVFRQDTAGKCTVNYPTLGCAGNWSVISSEAGRIVLQENIVEGKTICDQGNMIILTKVSETYLSVSFFLKDFPEKLIAHGILTRQ